MIRVAPARLKQEAAGIHRALTILNGSKLSIDIEGMSEAKQHLKQVLGHLSRRVGEMEIAEFMAGRKP